MTAFSPRRERVYAILPQFPEILAQPIDHEADIENMDFVWEDMIRKSSGEIHDPVIG